MNVEIPKLNVNVGLYLISLIAIAVGEYFNLRVTFYAGILSGAVSFLSIIWILPSYVRRYLRKDKN